MKVAHASAAVEETFDSLHMMLMCAAPRLEKLLLAGLLLETRFTGEWSGVELKTAARINFAPGMVQTARQERRYRTGMMT